MLWVSIWPRGQEQGSHSPGAAVPSPRRVRRSKERRHSSTAARARAYFVTTQRRETMELLTIEKRLATVALTPEDCLLLAEVCRRAGGDEHFYDLGQWEPVGVLATAFDALAMAGASYS